MRDFLVVYFGPGSRLRWVLLALAVLVLGWIAAQAQEMVLDRRVSASTDDAEERASGSVTKASSDLELVYDGTNQVVGMRFLDIAVPQGATITSAWIQFTADESQSEPTNLTIRAQLAASAATFATGTSTDGISSRSQTFASVSWQPPAWSTGQAGEGERTPDLAQVIQEVVDLPAWASGGALVAIVAGTGHRTAEAYDGSPRAPPLLHVEATTLDPGVGCLEPPSFPPDFSGPDCTPARQAERCACSECMTWDQASDLATIDEYEVSRRLYPGPSSWEVVGHTYKSQAWTDTDGTVWPEWISTTWCVGRDAPGLPVENVLYEYAVKACKTTNGARQCSASYSVPVLYRGTLYWDLVHP